MRKNTITLFFSESKRSKEIETNIQSFGKTVLLELLEDLFTALQKYNLVYPEEGLPNECRHVLNRIKNKGDYESLTHKDLLRFYSCFAADIRNIKAVSIMAMTRMGKLWETAATQMSLSAEEVKRILGRDGKSIWNTSSWYPRVANEVMLAPLCAERDPSYYWRNKKTYCYYLPQNLRKKAVETFWDPGINNPRVFKDLPEGPCRVESFINHIDSDIMFLNGIHCCNGLIPTLGNVTLAKLNSLSKKIKSPGFAYNIGDTPLDRKAMLALAFIEFVQSIHTDEQTTTANFALFIRNKFGKNLPSSDYHIMLPRYKGFTKTFTDYSRAHLINALILKLITPAANGWLDMKEFLLRYMCNDDLVSDSSAYTELFYPLEYNRHAKLKRTEDKHPSMSYVSVDLWSDITRPYIIHFIKLLCGVGIIEMAVDPDAPESDEMEGIRYITLTPLGKYAYGLTDKYEGMCEIKDLTENFELEQDALIVTLLDKDSPYSSFLEQLGRKIGGNRFHISAQSIVSKSKSKDDAKSRLESFKRVVCPNPTGIWADMIAEAEKRISPTIKIKENYMLYHLDISVPGLRDTILNDKEILENIILAQNGVVLVNVRFYEKFLGRLKLEGYLF